MKPKEIKEARLKLGLTQEDFAAQIGVRPETVHRWESGKFKPHAIFERAIRKLAKRKVAAA